MLLITVQPQLEGTRVALRFPWNDALTECLKEMPGVQWDKARHFWTCPKSAFAIIAAHVERAFTGVQWKFTGPLYPAGLVPISDTMRSTLHPYQIDAVQRFLSVPGYLLSFDPRVGKTPLTAAAIGSAFMQGRADVAVIIYPASVGDEWKRQLPQFTTGSPGFPGIPSNGLQLCQLEGHKPFDQNTTGMHLRHYPNLVIGCSWEILSKRLKDIQSVVNGRRCIVVADEIHRLRNRKSSWSVAGFALAHAPNTVYRWALTGTPMRNRPRDLWPTFEFIEKNSMGGYWTFVKRFSGAVEEAHGWNDKGTAKEHMPELRERLAAVSYRLTRADVAPWLPKSDDKMVLCSMDAKTAAFYAAQERAFAPEIQRAVSDGDHVPPASMEAMKRLAQTVVGVKIPTLIERVQFHGGDRKVKTLVFANFHEPLIAAETALRAAFPPSNSITPAEIAEDDSVPIYCAGGWMTVERRKRIIEEWKADPRPACLLANTLSSGIGIDLSAAEVTLFLELSWVPADFLQTKARSENIHLADERSAPPLSEYLLVKNTIDQDMAMALIQKFTNIEAVVGADTSSSQTNEMLRGTGLVERGALGLRSEDPEVVAAALTRLRNRLLGISEPTVQPPSQNIALAADVAEAFDDEGENENVLSSDL